MAEAHHVIVKIKAEDFARICEAAAAINVSVNDFIRVAALIRADKALDG